MDKEILKGLKISFGFFLGSIFLFGIVFAVGFHSANEIIGGVFQGNYTFNGTVKFGNVQTCDSSSNGSVRVDSTYNSFEFCTGTEWKVIASADRDFSSCLEAIQFDDSYISGSYQITMNGTTQNLHCEMSTDNGGWTLLAKVSGSNNNAGWNYLNSIWYDNETMNESCMGDTSTNCDGKSRAFYTLNITKLYIVGPKGTVLYNLNQNQTFNKYFEFIDASYWSVGANSLGTEIGTQYGGTSPNADYLYTGTRDPTGNDDLCVLIQTDLTSHPGSTDYNNLYVCAGRHRSSETFTYYPTNLVSGTADLSGYSNGNSYTYNNVMLIYGKES